MRIVFTCLLGLILIAGCGPQNQTVLTDRQFLQKYGWTVTQEVATHRVELPNRFADEPGAFPVGFYWAYNNELSKSLGTDFDLSRYAGQTVIATMYDLAETLPDNHPNPAMRAVVLHHEGKLIGAYLDRYGHDGFAASLDGKRFTEIIGIPFGTWLEQTGVIDWDHPTYRELAPLAPEEVIHAFYDALDQHKYEKAYTFLNLTERLDFLFANRDPDWLHNPNFAHQFGGLRNISGASVKKINSSRDLTGEASVFSTRLNWQPYQIRQFGVSLDLRFVQIVAATNGPNHLFITLTQERPGAPWLISGINTGP